METYSLIVLRARKHASIMRCAVCGVEMQAVTVEQAAGICSVTQRTIFGLIEADRLHFHEILAGDLLICAESLRWFAEEATR